MGIEKVVPRAEDLGVFLPLLARSATGQAITTYTSFFHGPRSGGHSYGTTVPGPIGSILAPVRERGSHGSLPHACTLCGSCGAVCPVGAAPALAPAPNGGAAGQRAPVAGLGGQCCSTGQPVDGEHGTCSQAPLASLRKPSRFARVGRWGRRLGRWFPALLRWRMPWGRTRRLLIAPQLQRAIASTTESRGRMTSELGGIATRRRMLAALRAQRHEPRQLPRIEGEFISYGNPSPLLRTRLVRRCASFPSACSL